MKYSHEQNYQRLIEDTYRSVKFLNSIELNVLEECLQVFRDNIFRRERSPSQFISILEENGVQNTVKMAKEMYHSMQIILEFMDKGMKGLLTGDLSAFAIRKMETSI